MVPWNVLAGGKIRTDEEEERRRRTGEKGKLLLFAVRKIWAYIDLCWVGRTVMGLGWERTEEERKMCKALEEVARQVGAKNIQAGEGSSTH